MQSYRFQVRTLIQQVYQGGFKQSQLSQLEENLFNNPLNYEEIIDTILFGGKIKKTKMKELFAKSKFLNYSLISGSNRNQSKNLRQTLIQQFKSAGLFQDYQLDDFEDLIKMLEQDITNFKEIIQKFDSISQSQKANLIKAFQNSTQISSNCIKFFNQSKINIQIPNDKQNIQNPQFFPNFKKQKIEEVKILQRNQSRSSFQQKVLKNQDLDDAQKNVLIDTYVVQKLKKQNKVVYPLQDQLSQILSSYMEKQDMLNAIQSILENPSNFGYIIEKQCQNLQQDQKKEIIKKLEKCQQLIQKAKNINILPIHQFILKPPNTFLKIQQLLFTYKFKNQQWNKETICSETKIVYKSRIRQLLQNNQSPLPFFYFFSHLLNDCIVRKVQIYELLAILKKQILLAKVSKNLASILKRITMNDIIIMIIFWIKKCQNLILDLHKISYPIVIYFKVPSLQGYKSFKRIDILLFFLRNIKFNYVLLNFGFKGAKKLEKTKILQQIFDIDKFITSSNDSHFQAGSIQIHTNLGTVGKGKKILAVDFHGAIEEQKNNVQYNQLFEQILQVSNIFLVHTKKEEIQKEDSQLNKIISKYQKGQIKKNIICLIHDKKTKNLTTSIQQGYIHYISSSSNVKKFKEQIQQLKEFLLKEMLEKIEENTLKNKISSYFCDFNVNQAEKQIDLILKKLQDGESINFPCINSLQKKYQLQMKKYQLEKKVNDKNDQISRLNFKHKESIQIQEKQIDINVKTRSSEIVNMVQNLQKQNKVELLKKLSQAISQKSKAQIDPIQRQYIQVSNSIEKIKEQIKNKQTKNENFQGVQKLKKEVEELQIKRKYLRKKNQEFDISIDTIYSEMIASDSINQKEKYKQIIIRNYQKSIQLRNPTNIIDGRTLVYGNKYLNLFFQRISEIKKDSNKDVYVVSVIGPQSSAKSTLMNYLFGCSFAASAGRCTKGVYYSLVETENKILVIIDTQGLVSVCARDTVFDHQITSLVMKSSDLVIINSKGEMNKDLKNLLDVCMYVIQQLYKKDHEQPNPVKLMFVLRDISDSSKQKQQCMLKHITQALGKDGDKQTISYTKYFDIKQDNIFPIPSAFNDKNSNFCNKIQNNTIFGKLILLLRQKIINNLNNPKHQSLNMFYKNTKICWNTIIKCGTDIFNYKSLHQIQIKKAIDDVCKQKYYELKFDEDIQKIRDHIISQLSKISPDSSLDKKQNQLIQYINNTIESFIQNFSEQVKKGCYFCKISDWIKQKIQKHKQNFYIQRKACMNYLKSRVHQVEINSKKKQFVDQIKQIILNINKQNKTQQEIKIEFNEKAQLSLKKISQKYQQILNNYEEPYEIQKIKNIFWSCWCEEFKYEARKKKEELLKIISHSQKQSTFFDYILAQKINKVTLRDNEKNRLFSLWKKHLQQSKNYFLKYYEKLQLKQLSQHKKSFEELYKLIHPIYIQFRKKIKQLDQDYKLKQSFELYIQDLLFLNSITYIPIFIQNRIKMLSGEQYHNSKQKIKQWQKKLQKSLKDRQNQFNITQKWQQLIEQQILTKIKQSIKCQLEKILITDIEKDLQKQKIIDKSFDYSIRNRNQGKQKWINCWKLVTNMNYYLKEVLYSSANIKLLKSSLKNIKNNYVEKISMQLEKIKKFLLKEKNIQKKVMHKQNTYLKYCSKNLLETDPFLVTADQKLIKSIILKLAYSFENKKQNYSLELFNKVNIDQINQYLSNKLDEIQHKIFGCSAVCPICYIKCCKQKNHKGGHQVMKNCHILQCFGGTTINKTNKALTEMCYSKRIDERQYKFQNQQYCNFVQFIKYNEKQWYQHFNKSQRQQVSEEKKQVTEIWANVKDMFIKHMYPKMIDNQKYKVIDPLNDQDMEKERQNPLQEKIKILSILSSTQNQFKEPKTYKLKDYYYLGSLKQ